MGSPNRIFFSPKMEHSEDPITCLLVDIGSHGGPKQDIIPEAGVLDPGLLGDVGETPHQLHLSLPLSLDHFTQQGGEEGGLAGAHAAHHRTQAPLRDPAQSMRKIKKLLPDEINYCR
jgi:hypothetical protein